MHQSKYVVIEQGIRTAVIIGGEVMGHNELAQGQHGEVVSAGFFQIGSEPSTHKLDINVYGDSTTLKVKSDPPRDRRLIACALGLDPADDLIQP